MRNKTFFFQCNFLLKSFDMQMKEILFNFFYCKSFFISYMPISPPCGSLLFGEYLCWKISKFSTWTNLKIFHLLWNLFSSSKFLLWEMRILFFLLLIPFDWQRKRRRKGNFSHPLNTKHIFVFNFHFRILFLECFQ